MNLILPDIPSHSILGINYNSVHDSSIAILNERGKLIFACSLERVSRVKQDGRPPVDLLRLVPWDRIESVAVSTNEKLDIPANSLSRFHPAPFDQPRSQYLIHQQEFYQFLETLPAPKTYHCHQESHVAAAFYLSGFSKALGFSYDGGMHNCPWFGGLYDCTEVRGIIPIDRFASTHYSKITSLYTIVTAMLGFTPNKHEGKITGLAAYGKASPECRQFLKGLFTQRYEEAEAIMEWLFAYSHTQPPILCVNETRVEKLRQGATAFSREDLAATVQAVTEEHVSALLHKAMDSGIRYDSICLSGGLFANVKINQRIKELGFANVFVCPPMTDDGTALGAALLHVKKTNPGIHLSQKIPHMFWGFSFDQSDVLGELKKRNLKYHADGQPAEIVADALARDYSVAVYQKHMEFGPRALGNRSVLASATHPEINKILNKKFHRTEFMPFAPMTLMEDAHMCYENMAGAEHTAEFMTMTFNCKPMMKEKCPAVVHIDGTARPQLIRKEIHPFIYEVISLYKTKTGNPAIINTSFNMHEEPIICTPEDAIFGFLESGIDLLCIEGVILWSSENMEPALHYLRSQISAETQKEQRLNAITQLLAKKSESHFQMAVEKEAVIQTLLKQSAKPHQPISTSEKKK